MKHRILHYIFLFAAGFFLYPLLEICFRGYTHISMAILGGIALVFIGFVDLSGKGLPLFVKAFASAVIITQLELICGLIVNYKMELQVWDYSHLPFQFAGQISLLFSTLWFLLSYFILSVFHFFRIRKQTKNRILS